jgi:hypothetical protein
MVGGEYGLRLSMPNHIVKDNQVHFRQSFPLPVLCKLFVTLNELDVTVYESGSKVYPHKVNISESEFLSVLEIIEE